MMRGFLSFAVAAVFLFALLSAAGMAAGKSPDYSYERYRASLVYEVAIKRAFYSAISDSAAQALAASGATGAPPHAAIKEAIFLRALDFERQLAAQGYPVLFWCGSVSEQGRQDASAQMEAERGAIGPQGSLPLSDCADSFGASALERKIHLSNLGFSVYFPPLRIARAALFPEDYEVGF